MAQPSVQREVSTACRDPSQVPRTPPTGFVHPNDQQVQGLDVSQAQGDVPWKTLSQSHIAFTFIRASEGTNITDRRFKYNWTMSKACGFPRGAYHVFQPGQSVEGQTELFLSLLGDDHGELPPVLDVEIPKKWVPEFPSPDEYAASLVQMADAIEKKTGWVPMIYIQPWYWNDYLDGSHELTRYHLWAAGTTPRAREGWTWTFWQRNPHVHWAERQWDHDIFRGSLEELRAFSQSKGAIGSTASSGG